MGFSRAIIVNDIVNALIRLLDAPVGRLDKWRDEHVEEDDKVFDLAQVFLMDIVVFSSTLILLLDFELISYDFIKDVLELQVKYTIAFFARNMIVIFVNLCFGCYGLSFLDI